MNFDEKAKEILNDWHGVNHAILEKDFAQALKEAFEAGETSAHGRYAMLIQSIDLVGEICDKALAECEKIAGEM